jgi:hypothetical protein
MPRRRSFLVLLAQTIVALAIFVGALTIIERWTDRIPHLNEHRSVSTGLQP